MKTLKVDNVAQAYLELGRTGLAVEELERVLTLDPRHREARTKLATLRAGPTSSPSRP